MDTYDVVVVGGGPAGEVVAGRTVGSGLTAVVVSRSTTPVGSPRSRADGSTPSAT
ncbi:hypothetical protein ACIQZB_26370 [Streptomyces sp. NPDC097727]|uniref:hypothetical protein n=1 Tax=Streptomyces sp. NPDC097727 TaxID=3366092 RepID=UPI0038069B0C